jgi:amidase
MDREGLYHCPAVQRPTTQQLQSLAETARFHISPEDLEQYKVYISQLLTLYDRVEKLIEPTSVPASKYRQSAGYRPSPENNPYNAWAQITDIAGAPTGKLAGKAIAIKDMIHVAGVPMTCGSTFLRGFISSYNATVVNRILDAGGLIKGKSTCENMCFSGNSFSPVTGPVLNPYDTTRSSGGTSSGSAVLVATGEVDMAIGSDTAGSVNLPSCWCGIVGLKPTYGLVPYTGTLALDSNLDHLGPMARTVYDCALLLEVIAGYDGGLDPAQSPALTVPNYTEHLTGEVSGLRVGLLKEGFDGCEPDVAETVRNAADSLKQLGVTVDEFSTSLHHDVATVATVILLEGAYDSYRHGGLNPVNSKGFKDTATHDFLFNASRAMADTLPPNRKMAYLLGPYIRENYGCHFYAKSINILRELSAKYDELFQNYDVIIMPTIKFKAPKLPAVGLTVLEFIGITFENATNTITYNGTGYPTLSINAGFSDTEPRLPIGMMMVGRRHDDVTVLRLAHAYERLRDSSPAYVEAETALKSAMKSKASKTSP